MSKTELMTSPLLFLLLEPQFCYWQQLVITSTNLNEFATRHLPVQHTPIPDINMENCSVACLGYTWFSDLSRF
jgi:hypothetical protein